MAEITGNCPLIAENGCRHRRDARFGQFADISAGVKPVSTVTGFNGSVARPLMIGHTRLNIGHTKHGIGHTMAEDSLRTLARHLGVPERTVRRAASEGSIHGRARQRAAVQDNAAGRGISAGSLVPPSARERGPPDRAERAPGGVVRVDGDRRGIRADRMLTCSWRARGDGAIVAALAERLRERVGRDVQIVRGEDARRCPP